MRIGVNARFLLKNKMEGFGWYSYEILSRMVQKHPETNFVFFFDRAYDSKFIFGANVEAVIVSPPARHPILQYIWFEIALKKAIKKAKVDVFFSPDGYLSLASKIPQYCTIHDINFEHFPKDLPWSVRTYLRYFFPKFAKKAKHIFTVSNFSKEDIIKQYQLAPEKISVCYNAAADQFKPLAPKDKKAIEAKLTHGQPYFIFVGSLHPRKNVQRLLQAYESYAQKNETPWKLVIVGAAMWKNENYTIPSTIKDHIIFTGHLSNEYLVKTLGAASCLVYVPYFEGFGMPLVEAMQSGVPIIAGNKSSLPEVIADAGVLVNPFDIKEIASKMELIAHSEQLRSELIEKGLKRAKDFSWDKASEEIYLKLSKG